MPTTIAMEALPPNPSETDPAGTEIATENHDVAIGAAVTSADETEDSKSLIAIIHGLKEGQSQQTQLIQKLHKTVLNTRTIINELIVTQNELRDEIEKLRASPDTPATVATCEICKSSVLNPVSAAPVGLGIASPAPPTPDDEIDAIIEGRKSKNQWPVKHSTLNCFSVQADLVKLRFHHSEKYQHIPVRIPKTDNNKDGTKPCKLCSEGKVRRKVSTHA